MQKGTRKTAETREMLRNTIVEIKEKLRSNMFHDLLSIRVNGKHIQGCIEQNPKKVLMPIYLPPGFYIVCHDVAVPNWLICPSVEKLEKNMYWKASGISDCDDSSGVIPFSLASLQLRGYIFSLKCDDAIGILEIYPRKQPNSTPKAKTVKKDQSNKLELKMKKALTLSNNDNINQQQSNKQQQQKEPKQQQQQNNNKQQQHHYQTNNKQQQLHQQRQPLSIQPIKVENENDIDQCSLTSCTKRPREHANDSGWVSFLEPQRSERKRVKIGKDMKENQSISCKPHDASAVNSSSSSSTAVISTTTNTNVVRAFDDEDLSSFLCDIDTFAPSLPGIPSLFDGINYGNMIGAQQQHHLHHHHHQ